MGMPWAGSKYLGFRAVWLTWLCSCQTLFDNIGVSLWPQAKVCKPLSWAGGHVTPASWVGWEPLVSPPSPDRSCKSVYFVSNVVVQQVGRWLYYGANMECCMEKETTEFEFWRIWYRETLTMWRKRNGILNTEKWWWCVWELDRRDTTYKTISLLLNLRGNLY